MGGAVGAAEGASGTAAVWGMPKTVAPIDGDSNAAVIEARLQQREWQLRRHSLLWRWQLAAEGATRRMHAMLDRECSSA